jgi:hypothetical protein
MPWCPVCHAEYRAGVKVCRQCRAELVSAPPRAGEHYVPPAESLFDTAAEKLVQSGRLRAWGRQFVDGLRLFGESFRLMLRMRNAWLVLAVMTAASTVITLRPPQPINSATLAVLRERNGPFPVAVGQSLQTMWSSLPVAVGHVSADLRAGLGTPLGYLSWLYVWLYLRNWTGPGSLPHWYAPGPLGIWFLATLVGALFLAGMLWWVLAAVRGEQQTPTRFWEGVRRSFWPLLAWTLVYGLGYRTLLAFASGRGGPTTLHTAFLAVVTLAVLSFVFTSEVIVVQRPPVYEAPGVSMQILAKRLFVVLGFALPFIVLHDLVWATDAALRYYYYLAWAPDYAYRYAVPVVAFAVQMAKVAVELTIATALVILVARWSEANRTVPAPPEAAA